MALDVVRDWGRRMRDVALTAVALGGAAFLFVEYQERFAFDWWVWALVVLVLVNAASFRTLLAYKAERDQWKGLGEQCGETLKENTRFLTELGKRLDAQTEELAVLRAQEQENLQRLDRLLSKIGS